ncbi:MAG: PD-(D/E)XK nuclease family protein [Bacteroidia bacterium]
MTNNTIVQFTELVDFFRERKQINNSTLERFDKVIFEFKRLKSGLKCDSKNSPETLSSFIKLIDDYKLLVENVYPKRLEETEKLLDENLNKIAFSALELMDYDYRENSHSNILRYLFHHKLWSSGSDVLSRFIEKVTSDIELSQSILDSNYEIYREFYTKNGRIDLLIEDHKNKFIIVIENKILSNVAIKEYSEDRRVLVTQLDNYRNYVQENYSNYKTCFILLSLNEEEGVETKPFIKTNYKLVLEILDMLETSNNIVVDYKTLLNSIIYDQYGRYGKEWLLELHNKIKNKKRISLNTLEIANKYFQ